MSPKCPRGLLGEYSELPSHEELTVEKGGGGGENHALSKAPRSPREPPLASAKGTGYPVISEVLEGEIGARR